MNQQGNWTKAETDELLGEFKLVTVPVGISIEGRQKVVGFAETKRLLGRARLISPEECSCRVKMNRCEGSLDFGICMEHEAEEAIEKRRAHATTLDVAMDPFQRSSHDTGLVHL